MSNIQTTVVKEGYILIKQNYGSIYELKREIYRQLEEETCKYLTVEFTSHPYDIDPRYFLGDACFRHGFNNLESKITLTSINGINESYCNKIWIKLRTYVEDGQYPAGQVKNFKE